MPPGVPRSETCPRWLLDGAGQQASFLTPTRELVAAMVSYKPVSLFFLGYYRVLEKGKLPKQTVMVKVKFFSRKAEKKIKDVWGSGTYVLVA